MMRNDDVRWDRVRTARELAAKGHYDDPVVMAVVADRVLQELRADGGSTAYSTGEVEAEE